MFKGSLEEALSHILRDMEDKVIVKKTEIQEIPLKERYTTELKIFNENFTKAMSGHNYSKSDYKFLVCGGAAGIGIHSIYLHISTYCHPLLTLYVLLSGKTRWGKEFLNTVQNWKLPNLDPMSPVFLYLLLDFINGVRIGDLDKNQSASIILGLRIAYDFFARKKK
jgi:hypothetical protein